MNEQSQIAELCGNCGYKREYHRLYKACKKCAAIKSAKHYQAGREKINAKAKMCQLNIKKKYQKKEKGKLLQRYKIFIIKQMI